jgi:Zn-dependent alcohol dehydrogenase
MVQVRGMCPSYPPAQPATNGTGLQRRARTDTPRIVGYMDGKIHIDDWITHSMPLEKINDAFEPGHKGESIRSVTIY